MRFAAEYASKRAPALDIARDMAESAFPRKSPATGNYGREAWGADAADLYAGQGRIAALGLRTDDPPHWLKKRHLIDRPFLSLNAPFWYVTTTAGTGKTHIALKGLVEFILRWDAKRLPRIIWMTERHDLLNEVRTKHIAAIDDCLSNQALPKPQRKRLEAMRAAIFHVRDAANPGACGDADNAKRHKEFANTPVRRRKVICGNCALKDSCQTYAVNGIADDASGVFLVSASNLNRDGGKYDLFGTDLAVIDEDAAQLLSCELDAQSLNGTGPETLVASIAADTKFDFKQTKRDAELPLGDAMAAIAAKQGTLARRDGLTAWSRALDRQIDDLNEEVEAHLGDYGNSGAQSRASALVQELHQSQKQQRLAETLLIAYDSRWIHAPVMVRVEIVSGVRKASVIVQTDREGLRRSWSTPLIMLNATPQLTDTLKAAVAMPVKGFTRRPIFEINAQVERGAGTTHIAVTTDFIGQKKLAGDGDGTAKQTNIHSLERFCALMAALHGNGGAIMQKSGEGLAAQINAIGVVDDVQRALGRRAGYQRLHWNAQRGTDSLGKAGWLVCVGQPQPTAESCTLAARARGLRYDSEPGGGQFELVPVPIECADGSFTAAYTYRHPDFYAAHEHERVVADECVQGVHRLRPVRREPADPAVLVTIGTEFGTCGVPVDKFARLTDVRGVRDIDVVAATGVVPMTPAAMVRSRFGAFFGAGPNGGPLETMRAATNIEKNGLLPSAQQIVDAVYILELTFGTWRTGAAKPSFPTWGVFEGRPSVVVDVSSSEATKETPMELVKKEREIETPVSSMGVYSKVDDTPVSSAGVCDAAKPASRLASLNLARSIRHGLLFAA